MLKEASALPLQPTHSGSGSNPAAGTLYNKDLVWLNLFNAALSRKRYWRGLESQEARDYAQHYAVTTRMIPAFRWAATKTVLMFHEL